MRYIAIFDLPEGEKHAPNAYAHIYPPTEDDKQRTVKGRLQEVVQTGSLGEDTIIAVRKEDEQV